MAADLRTLPRGRQPAAAGLHGDARRLVGLLAPCSVDAVITSPPYPNEKDYTRTTRLESVLLGFITSKRDLRDLTDGLSASELLIAQVPGGVAVVSERGIKDEPDVQRREACGGEDL